LPLISDKARDYNRKVRQKRSLDDWKPQKPPNQRQKKPKLDKVEKYKEATDYY